MEYKNKTNIEYQNEYYSKNKVNRKQYYKDYYKQIVIIYEYINIYIIAIKNMNTKEI